MASFVRSQLLQCKVGRLALGYCTRFPADRYYHTVRTSRFPAAPLYDWAGLT